MSGLLQSSLVYVARVIFPSFVLTFAVPIAIIALNSVCVGLLCTATAVVVVVMVELCPEWSELGPFAIPFALRNEIPTRSVGKGIDHFFGAIRIDAIDADEFKGQVDDYIRVFRATKPAPGTNGPLIPGDPERQAEQVRRDKGVSLIAPVVEDLLDIAVKTGIRFAEAE